MEHLSNRKPEEIKEVYDLVESEINKFLDTLFIKTGYYCTGSFALYGDPMKKCMDVDMEIAMLQTPHELEPMKLQHYMKVNPDNCLNKTVMAHKHNSWYMIYDGAHRTEANRLLGKQTIKVNLIVPCPDK
jgi:hypothetical protein